MDLQTREQMLADDASEFEAAEAEKLGKLLRPCLKVNRKNGRVMTAWHTKTLLGLYRSIKREVQFSGDPNPKEPAGYTVIGIYDDNNQSFSHPIDVAKNVEDAIKQTCKELRVAERAVRVISVLPGVVKDLWTDQLESERTGVSYE